MMAASPALMGAIGAGPRPLVRRGAVDAPALLTRAQVGSRATRLASAGGWVEIGADVSSRIRSVGTMSAALAIRRN